MNHKFSDLVRTYSTEILSLLLMLAAMVIAHNGLDSPWIFVPALLPVCPVMLRGTWKAFRRGDIFNEFTLMILACAGAFIIGEYPEAVAIIVFYSFGEKLEDSASDQARERIKALIDCMPREVRVIAADGTATMTAPDKVEPGQIIEVRPGERVGLDGTLYDLDEARFNNSAITGESLPVNIARGGNIPSGAIPEGSTVKIKVTHRYSDSSMSRIMSMIEDAANHKSRSESLLRRITRWYTPAVMIAAILLFAVPWALSLINHTYFDWHVWFERALVLLVCSCPCALIVSIPLSYFAAIGAASKFGVLFKGSSYLDSLRQCDSLLLDKTGTITTGNFEVIKAIPTPGHTKENLVALASMAEADSNHPLAKAICRTGLPKVPNLDITKITEVNHGIVADTNKGKLLVGSRKLMQANNIDLSDSTSVEDTEVCVALNGEFIGSIVLADTLKPGIAETLLQLRRLGVKSIGILSGDNERAVASAARQAGVDFHKSQLLPADKQHFIMKRVNNGRHTIFIGDGINDAPSLAAATVGIAIGTGGSDIAMQSADAVIMGHDLNHLVGAMKLSRRLKAVVAENVTLAIGVKLAVMILGAMGIASLWAAVFADTGIMVITVLWTMIALRPRK